MDARLIDLPWPPEQLDDFVWTTMGTAVEIEPYIGAPVPIKIVQGTTATEPEQTLA